MKHPARHLLKAHLDTRIGALPQQSVQDAPRLIALLGPERAGEVDGCPRPSGRAR
ncbi:hypothetical protein OG819_00010 [Streptomyces sp. NBC_01549]|uniref:hypothetical protein n=1 Tax=Streptomyces sp. NBC_01549 TaxID=2975874 RepID=UPI0022593D34|nr:hypothetical protein [Streptomyces sp. NBC_01549]MCX4588190.1 hypothetical protein [Streptomyces sp. NBC_01549]